MRWACACPGARTRSRPSPFRPEIRCAALDGRRRRQPSGCCGPHTGLLHLAVRDVETAQRGRGASSGAGPRHELRRAAQRGDAALPVLLLRRAGHDRRADHRRHRAALVARLGAGAARAAARRGHPAPDADSAAPELRPIERDLRELIRDLERQYRPLDGSQRIWTAGLLRATLHSELRGNDIIAVSNREPYIHVRTPQGIRVQNPASGLVTALEPVMRACSGTWIAHGSGSADRETVDANDRVDVPPDQPAYRLRRVWLTRRGGGRLLQRLRQRGPLAALPHRARAPDVPFAATSSTTGGSTRGSPTRSSPRPAPTTRSCWCRTTTSRCCRG